MRGPLAPAPVRASGTELYCGAAPWRLGSPGGERQRIDGVATEMSPGELGAVLPGMLEVSYYGNAE